MNPIRQFADYLFIIYEDDFPDEKSRKIGFSFTALFCIVFAVLSFFIVIKPKEPEYKEIKISLASPDPEKLQAQDAAKTAAVENSLSTAQAVQTVKKEPEQPAQKSQPAQPPQSAKTAQSVKPAKPQRQYTPTKQQKFFKSTEELMAEQFNSGKAGNKNSEWKEEEEVFNKSANTVSTTPESSAITKNKQLSDSESTIGTAGTASGAGSETPETSVSSSTSRGSGTEGITDGVKQSLENIGSAKPVPYSGASSGNIATTSVINSYVSESSGLSIQMEGGRFRRLLEPERPVINISEENAKLIETSFNLKIRFKVLSDGSVLLSGIQIPSSSLPQSVQLEIKRQIATWRFALDPSESTAVFDFSIIKK